MDGPLPNLCPITEKVYDERGARSLARPLVGVRLPDRHFEIGRRTIEEEAEAAARRLRSRVCKALRCKEYVSSINERRHCLLWSRPPDFLCPRLSTLLGLNDARVFNFCRSSPLQNEYY